MQVEENLAEIQQFASQNGYPREIIHSIWKISHQMHLHQIKKQTCSMSLLSWLLKEKANPKM
jgi:hypothetical protein